MLKRDWEGRYVRLRRDMQTNGGVMFKAGEVMRVRENYGGLKLEALYVCQHCNRHYRAEIAKVSERDVVLLEYYVPEPQVDYHYELNLVREVIRASVAEFHRYMDDTGESVPDFSALEYWLQKHDKQ